MRVLALDTSSLVTVAVLDGDAVLSRAIESAPRSHVERLSPLIAEALTASGVEGARVEAVVVGTGPAPFTGLRIGLVTARMLSFAWGIPAWGVCSLDGLGAEHGGTVTVVTDARRREVYWATYAAGTRTGGPFATPPTEVRAVGDIVGRGALLYPEVFPGAGGTDMGGMAGVATTEVDPAIGMRRLLDPDPAWLARVAARRISAGETDLSTMPLYLRRPDTHGIANP